jgi:hypothetical protein
VIDADAQRLLELARTTREAQKAYFRERTTERLQASKRVERELDALIERLTAPAPVQGHLWGKGPKK